MRSLILVLLCSIALSAQAIVVELPGTSPGIDLDKPGALETLQRDNPAHFDAVMKKVEEVRDVPQPTLNVLRNLLLDAQNPLDGGRLVEPTYPARSRIGVGVDGTIYLITVYYTKDPAHVVPAR